MSAPSLDLPIDERARVEKTWAHPSGVLEWSGEVDHKVIGKRFLVTALIFMSLGGLEAAVMRLLLSRAERHEDQRGDEKALFVLLVFVFSDPFEHPGRVRPGLLDAGAFVEGQVERRRAHRKHRR